MNSSPAVVVASAAPTPRIRRITLAVDDPEMLAVPTVADATVGVYFGDEIGRSYSVRLVHPDGRKLDIEVFLHATVPGTAWAQAASPGDRVRLDHPNGWYSPGSGVAWQLLAADASGLPALCRILEELPAEVPAIVVAEVLDEEDLALLPARPNCTLQMTSGGNGIQPSRLAFLVAETALPVGRGYCWCAGEAGQTRAVRKYLRSLGWGREDYDITGYWRHDAAYWGARFEPVADEMMAVYRRARADGMSEQAAMEAVDEALERAGL